MNLAIGKLSTFIWQIALLALIIYTALIVILYVFQPRLVFFPERDILITPENLGLKYNTKEYMRQVMCPVLIIHSRDDELIPFEHGQELYNITKEPKEFLEINGSHNEGFFLTGKKYKDGLNKFLSRFVSGESIIPSIYT